MIRRWSSKRCYSWIGEDRSEEIWISPEAVVSLVLAAFKACSWCRELDLGRRLHCDVAATGLLAADIYVGNSLVNMYAKCGSLPDAQRAFDSMPRRDAVSWNTLMMGCAVNGESETTLKLFDDFIAAGSLDQTLEERCSSRTFVAALMACSALAERERGSSVDGRIVKARSLERGMAVHALATKCGWNSNLFVANTLIG